MKCTKCNVEAVDVHMVFNTFKGCPVCKEEVKPQVTPPTAVGGFKVGQIVNCTLSGVHGTCKGQVIIAYPDNSYVIQFTEVPSPTFDVRVGVLVHLSGQRLTADKGLAIGTLVKAIGVTAPPSRIIAIHPVGRVKYYELEDGGFGWESDLTPV